MSQVTTINRTYLQQYSMSEGWHLIDSNQKIRKVHRTFRVIRRDILESKPIRCFCCGVEPNAIIHMIISQDSPTYVFANITDGNVSLFNVDHIIPRSEGGCNRLENLRLSCVSCNAKRRSDMDDHEVNFMNTNLHLIRPSARWKSCTR